MEATIKTLLEEIKAIYEKLEQNIWGEYRGMKKIGEPGSFYNIHAQEFCQKVLELYRSYHPEYLSQLEIGNLLHTMNKEVALVEYAYQESIKHKNSFKKKNEVCNVIIKANKQIKSDLFGLFQILEKLQ